MCKTYLMRPRIQVAFGFLALFIWLEHESPEFVCERFGDDSLVCIAIDVCWRPRVLVSFLSSGKRGDVWAAQWANISISRRDNTFSKPSRHSEI